MLVSSAGVVADSQRALLDALGAVALVVGADGVVTDANESGRRLTGWADDDAAGAHLLWEGIADVAEAQALRTALASALADGATAQSGCIWRDAAGEDVALAWSVTALAGTGYALAVGIASADLGARLAEAKQLRQRADRLDVALSAFQAGWFDWDMEANVHHWAPDLYALFGVEPSADPPNHETWRSLLHPDDFPRVATEINESLRERRAFRCDYRIIRPDGETRWISSAGHYVFDREGRALRASGVAFDVTEQHLAQQALERERRFTEAVLDSVPGLLYLYNAEGRLVRWNRQHELLTGYSAEELGQMTLLDWYRDSPEDIARITAGVQRALETGFGEEEGNLLTKDRGRVLHHFTAVRVEIDGETYFAGIGIDISEKRRAELALRESEARHRAMIAGISDVIAIIDADGINRYKSPNLERWFGWRPEEVVGRDTWENVHPDDRAASQRIFAGLFEQPGGPVYGECRYRCKDTSYKWIGYTAVNLLDDPDVRGVLLNYSDITARRRMEEALAEERERLAVTLHSIGDGVIATDTQGYVVLCNKVAERLTGWRAAEAVGRPLSDVLRLVAADTRQPLPDPAQRTMASGDVVELAERTLLLSRDGAEYVIADSGAPIRDRDSQIIGAVLVFRDVTGEEHRDTVIRRSQKLESLAILAGGVAHDFNNLLTGILGNVSLARLEAGENSSLAFSLAEAESAAVRARGLTQQLLTFASGGAPVRRLAHIEDVVRSTTVFCCRGSAVDCRFNFDSDLWMAEIDEDQIAQVVQNLVINAIQAMPDGGTLSVTATNQRLSLGNAHQLRPGPYLRLTVSDQGSGMTAAVLDHAFDPYFSTKAQGSGLGLAVCHSVITRHAGHIAVASTPGVGTTFDLYLPATPDIAATRSAARTTQTAEAAAAEQGAGRILVLDDESSIRSLATRVLERLGYEATTVGDGLEAVAAYAAARDEGRPFAAVIMDLTIPGGMGGREALGLLREMDPSVRAVVSSGYATDPIMADYAQHGFRAVLSKPYRLNDMAEVLREVLEG